MGEGLALGGPRCHSETRGRGRGSGGAGVPSSAVLARAAPGFAAIVPVGTTVPARHENLPVAYAARGLHENAAVTISTPNGKRGSFLAEGPGGLPTSAAVVMANAGAGFATTVPVGTAAPARHSKESLPFSYAARGLHDHLAVCVHGDRVQRCCMREPYQASNSSLPVKRLSALILLDLLGRGTVKIPKVPLKTKFFKECENKAIYVQLSTCTTHKYVECMRMYENEQQVAHTAVMPLTRLLWEAWGPHPIQHTVWQPLSGSAESVAAALTQHSHAALPQTHVSAGSLPQAWHLGPAHNQI